jgi:hypothetical protein
MMGEKRQFSVTKLAGFEVISDKFCDLGRKLFGAIREKSTRRGTGGCLSKSRGFL